MFFRRQKLCPGSGKSPVKMRVAFFYHGKELDLKAQDELFRKGKEPQVKLLPDADGDWTCPWCEGYMDTDGPMVKHSKDVHIVPR